MYMKKIIAFGLMAIVSVFVFVSCSSSDNTPKGGYLKDVSYDVQAVRNSPDIEGELKTVKAIAVWKQPDAHGVSEHVHIVFSDETYAEFVYFNDYRNMKHHSPFYVSEGDICVIKVADDRVTFIENKTKQETMDEYNRKSRF